MNNFSKSPSLLKILSWLSPAFPIGAFSYSNGLERAVHDGLVIDENSLHEWIHAQMYQGSLWNDFVFLSLARRQHDDEAEILNLNDLALALCMSAHRHKETTLLGTAFLSSAEAWPVSLPSGWPRTIAYPVAVGAVCGIHRIEAEAALSAFMHSVVSQALSAGIRLGVLGQNGWLRRMAAFEDTIADLVVRSVDATSDDLGSCTIHADIAAMRHETQYSRLFRS